MDIHSSLSSFNINCTPQFAACRASATQHHSLSHLICPMPEGQCPFCLSPQQNLHHNLLCGDCVGQECTLVRNSCIESDRQIEAARDKINQIFDLCNKLQNGDTILALPDDPSTPNPSIKLMKNLAYRLVKLQALNTKAKVRNINRTIESLRSSIEQVKGESKAAKDTIKPSSTARIDTWFTQQINELDSQLRHFRGEKVIQVERQAVLLQKQQYLTLISLAFLGSPGRSGAGISSQRISKSLLFYNQPVLNLELLFNHNSKVLQINEFFENLIKFQLHLADLFKVDGVELPFLPELLKLLPDEQLFASIQDQEDFMYSGIKEPKLQRSPSPETSPSPQKEPDQVIRLGEAFKLPLSSKTLNLQRRARTEHSAESELEPKVEMTKRPSVKKESKNSLYGKTVVIVPHKILSKPFTKFSPQEFLRFLLTVAKIIANFLYFFEVTINRVPTTRSTSLSNVRTGEVDDFNLTSILTKLLNMAQYFDFKLTQLKNENQVEMTGSQSLVSTVSNVSTTNSSVLPLQSYVKQKKPRGLLERLFGDTDYKLTDMEGEIYGGVSESSLTKTTDSSKPSPETKIPELKVIMQAVYKLMVSGASARAHQFTSTTFSMMAESKEQLDDWDVVSKLH